MTPVLFYNKCIFSFKNLKCYKNTFLFQTYPRDHEVKQLCEIIKSEKKDSYIFRTDINSFFESLPFQKIVVDLFKRNLITKTTHTHLINIYKKISNYGFEGLPRGLSISSSLSEYALQDFDYKTRNMDECFYYSRYVDDIVLVTTKEVNKIKEKIKNYLPYNLSLNLKKTFYDKIGDDKYIEFLGYSFNLKDVNHSKISQKKIDKIKKRIALSIKCFVKTDENYQLLLDRLKFLSGNSVLKIAGRKKTITVGIRYQYQLCTDNNILIQLKELDTFLKRILFSKNYYISKRLRDILKDNEMKQLSKISFLAGYNKKITTPYDRENVARIKDAWRYE